MGWKEILYKGKLSPKELKEFVLWAHQQGYAAEQIVDDLVSNGYAREEVRPEVNTILLQIGKK